MLITIFSIIIAILVGVFAPLAMTFDPYFFSILMLVSGIMIFFGTVFLNSFVLIPLENLEQKLIPNLMEVVRHNFLLRSGRLILFLFVFLSVVSFPFMNLFKNPSYQQGFFLGWIVFFGLALDVLRSSWNHLTNLLNPSYLVKHISHTAISAIQNDQNDLFRDNLDNLAEVGLRAVEKSKLALGTQTLQAFPPIIHSFFASAKSISHTSHDLKTGSGTGLDEASFIIFYLLHRLEIINDRALRERLETICRQMIMVLGKIIIYSAQYDLSMVSFPTHFLTKFGLKAQQHHFDEVAVLTTSTLIEIARTILTDIEITYAELQEPFRAIINGLDALAKGTFKKYKQTSIAVLTQPFLDLKALFQTEKAIHHRDTPVILQEIDRVLEEYTVLAQVLSTLPNLPNLGDDQEPTPSPIL